MSLIQLLPYTEVDGIRTLTDSYMHGIYNQLIEEGTFKTLFYTGCCQSPQDFVNLFKHGQNQLYMGTRDGIPECIVWLNDFKATTAYIHFCVFKPAWGKGSIELGTEILQQLINMRNADGYFFTTLLGLIPECNRKAIKYVQAIGMTKAVTLPNMCYNYWENKVYNGVLTFITRENQNENI